MIFINKFESLSIFTFSNLNCRLKGLGFYFSAHLFIYWNDFFHSKFLSALLKKFEAQTEWGFKAHFVTHFIYKQQNNVYLKQVNFVIGSTLIVIVLKSIFIKGVWYFHVYIGLRLFPLSESSLISFIVALCIIYSNL